MQQQSNDPRIEKMFSGDRNWAYLAVLVLWALYAFVLYHVMPYLSSQEELIALAVSGGLVLLFNTAAVIAMINHYGDDKQHIYGLDLRYLDEMKKR